MALILKNLLFTLVIPGTVAVYVPLAIAGDRAIESGIALILGGLIITLGAVIYAWCIWDFAVFGRGTPLPLDAPKKLVIRGLYRYSRNPMYVGVLMVIFGWAAMFGSTSLLLYALCVGTCFQLFIILYEERRLKVEFGEQYIEYCSKVGRWLPRLDRRRK